MFVFFIVTKILLKKSWGVLGLVSVPRQLVEPPSMDGYMFDRSVEKRRVQRVPEAVLVAILIQPAA